MEDEKELSTLTANNYNKLIVSLRRQYEDTLHTKFEFPSSFKINSDKIMEILESRYKKGSVNNYISAIIWTLDRLDRQKYPQSDLDEIYSIYRSHSKRIREENERALIGKELDLTEKEQKSFMHWEDIAQFHQDLFKNTDPDSHDSYLNYVILSLYVLHPPVRADYAMMKVFIDDSQIPSNFPDNYCVLQTNPRFVFQKYKTAKTSGTNIIPIDPELHPILIHWMGLNHSEYLLTTYIACNKSFKPISENALVKRIISLFTRYKNKPVSINTLRHSFVSYMYRYDQTKKEKQSNADKMMHSPSMAEKYRRMVYIE